MVPEPACVHVQLPEIVAAVPPVAVALKAAVAFVVRHVPDLFKLRVEVVFVPPPTKTPPLTNPAGSVGPPAFSTINVPEPDIVRVKVPAVSVLVLPTFRPEMTTAVVMVGWFKGVVEPETSAQKHMPAEPPLQAVGPVVALFGKRGVVGSFGLTQSAPQLRVLVQSPELTRSRPLQVQVIFMLAASALGMP